MSRGSKKPCGCMVEARSEATAELYAACRRGRAKRIIGSNRSHSSFPSFGTIEYSHRLTEKEIKSFELTEVKNA